MRKKKRKSKSILKFVGAFNPSEIKKMKTAIHEGCENIDKNSW